MPHYRCSRCQARSERTRLFCRSCHKLLNRNELTDSDSEDEDDFAPPFSVATNSSVLPNPVSFSNKPDTKPSFFPNSPPLPKKPGSFFAPPSLKMVVEN